MTYDVDLTGPPYPPIEPPASAFDWWKTVISQYANSPVLTQIIDFFDQNVDPTANLNAFYSDVWNIDTAQGWGLDVWGLIVGVSRILEVPSTIWFGFAEATPGSQSFSDAGAIAYYPAFGFQEGEGQPFNQAPFGLFSYWPNPSPNDGPLWSGNPFTTNFSLSDQAYRQLILAKAASNISDGSYKDINKILMMLFPGQGNCYVTDGNHESSYFGFAEAENCLPFNQGVFYDGESVPSMTMQYVFQAELSPINLAIVNSGVLPKPVGVSASIIVA